MTSWTSYERLIYVRFTQSVHQITMEPPSGIRSTIPALFSLRILRWTFTSTIEIHEIILKFSVEVFIKAPVNGGTNITWNSSNKSSVGKRTNLKTNVSRKQSIPNFPKNEDFLLPPDTHMYACVSEGKKCSFFGKFGVLCFLETPVLRFALLLYYRRTDTQKRAFRCV